MSVLCSYGILKPILQLLTTVEKPSLLDKIEKWKWHIDELVQQVGFVVQHCNSFQMCPVSGAKDCSQNLEKNEGKKRFSIFHVAENAAETSYDNWSLLHTNISKQSLFTNLSTMLYLIALLIWQNKMEWEEILCLNLYACTLL